MTKDEFITVFFGKLKDDEEFAERFHLENATFAKKMEIAEVCSAIIGSSKVSMLLNPDNKLIQTGI